MGRGRERVKGRHRKRGGDRKGKGDVWGGVEYRKEVEDGKGERGMGTVKGRGR